MAKIDNTASNTLISGTGGNDKITNYGDNVTINAGAGNDSIFTSRDYNNVTVNAEDGNDYIDNSSYGKNIEINGGNGNDTVMNWGYGVTISSGNGSDSIVNARLEDDRLYAGSYSSINSGDGNDYIYNTSYCDFVTISCGKGDDTICNESAESKIFGGVGNDSISYFHAWGNLISGGEGDDIIIGTGSDAFSDRNMPHTLDGGRGNDTVSLGSDAKFAIVHYNNGDGNELIYGFGDKSTLAIAGNSYSTQESGENIIVTVGKGKISLMGAASLSAVNIVTVSGGNVDDGGEDDTLPAGISVKNGTVTATSKFTGSKIDLADYSVNKINASAVTRNISIVGNAKKNTLRGGSGNDKLTGKGGADLFIFGAGNDTITDYVSGTDKISISGSYDGEVSGSNVILTTSKGTLTIKNSADKSITINDKTKKYSSGGNLSTGLSYNSSKTVLTANDNFVGGKIDLADYADTVKKVNAAKVTDNIEIIGNRRNNSLRGGKGSDTISGGTGNDTMRGGSGRDIFVYSTGDDVITDYVAGEDKIKLKNTKITDIKTDDNHVVFTTSKGTLTLQNAAGRRITIIDKDDNEITQPYSANIAEILADNSIGEFENYTEKLTAENLITFAE